MRAGDIAAAGVAADPAALERLLRAAASLGILAADAAGKFIHDWEDEKWIRLLKNCVQSMLGNGRVICVDSVLRPMGNIGGAPAKMLDLHMMVMLGGRERTVGEYRSLLRSAGLELERCVSGHTNAEVIVATPVGPQ